MKTIEGWLRGKICGKPFKAAGQFVCVLCGRRADIPQDLCYPMSM